MKISQKLMNKPVYLGLLILDLIKAAMYEFWCNYIKPRYDEKAKLYCIDTTASLYM